MKMKQNRSGRQSGATLMEVLVAMTISLVVTAAMVAMMSNTLGTTTRIIHMTKLQDDLRVTMQMMTRDLRRSNYNARAMYCYGNPDCDSDLAEDGSDWLTLADIIELGDRDDDGTLDCLTFQMDRGHTGNAATDGSGGGFRRVMVDPDDVEQRVEAGGIGVIQMWAGDPAPDCTTDQGWVDVTDPSRMDITEFSIDDSLSFTQLVMRDVSGNEVSQQARKLRMRLIGELTLDSTITRHVEDIISVRNDRLL